MIFWILSAIISTAAVIMSAELNDFDAMSYGNLFFMAVSFFYIGEKA